MINTQGKRIEMIPSKFMLLLAAMMCSVWAIGQGDVLDIQGNIRDTDSMKKLETVQITVMQNGTQFDQFTTSGSGKYSLELPLGHDYIISFAKNDYIAKKIQIKTKNIPEEDMRGGFQLAMDMSLFQNVEGFDTSILDKPIGKAGFDPQKNSINFDFGYTAAIQEEIEAEFERLEDLAKNMEKMLKKFDELVQKGDQKMGEEKYQDAIAKYEEALEIFPDKEPAPAKLAEALRKQDELDALAEKEAAYLKAIADGDSDLSAKEYTDAKAHFEEALNLKPSERLPKDKLKEIEELMAADANRAKYEEFIAEADRHFNNEDYGVSIETYESALEVMPNEAYPKDQINKAKRILDDLLAAEMAAGELEKNYQDAIKLGDRNRDGEAYRDAIRNYEKALSFKPDEAYPQDEIDKINQILEDLAAAEADAAANAAADAEKERIDREYQAALDEANGLFDKEELESALEAYQKASDIKPAEKFPKSRMERIRQMMDDQSAALAASAEEERKRLEEERAAADALADQERLAKEAELEAERQRRLEEEEAERKRREAERLAEEEEARRRQEEFNNNASTSTEDEAERYYREARESEARAKVKAMEQEKEEHEAYIQGRIADADIARKGAVQDAQEKTEVLERIYRDGEANRKYHLNETEQVKEANAGALLAYQADADYRIDDNIAEAEEQHEKSQALAQNDTYRRDKVIDSQSEKDRVTRDLVSYEKKGAALRSDNEYEAKKSKEQQSSLAITGDKVREKTQGETDEIIEQNRKFQNDTQSAASERRKIAEEGVNSDKQTSESLPVGKEIYREENAHEAEKAKKDNAFLLGTKREEAELRTMDARKELFDKDAGTEKKPNEYILPETAADLDEGVHERSYEMGNKMVIERTVKRGNKVDTYRKVISKTGIYYFKNDVSTTETTWVRETLEVTD